MSTSGEDLEGVRILIAHDWLTTWAGSERCVEQMVRAFPSADVVVGLCVDSLRQHNDVTQRARETWLTRIPGARRHHRWFLPLQGMAFATVDTEGYDLVLSSAHAFSKMVRARPGVPHVCYCHSPPRYLWDLRSTYHEYASPLQRLAMTVSGPLLRRMDRRSAEGIDVFVANSRYVKGRIRRAYGRTAAVVHPPVEQKQMPDVTTRRDDFLLTLGRLVPYKRVDLVIQAAEQLGMRLVVAGDGPQRRALERMAGKNTEFLGEVSEADAGRLLSTCGAFVFCAEEDFGITPVEANAHGAPVIAFGTGGVTESMVPGETAEFFHRQTVADVAAAIRRARRRSWDDTALRRNAARFAPHVYRSRMRALVRGVLASRTNDGCHCDVAPCS